MSNDFSQHQLHIIWYAKGKYGRSESYMDDLKVIVSLISGCDISYINDRDVLFWVKDMCDKLIPIEKMQRLYFDMFHNVYLQTKDTISIEQLISLMLIELRWINVNDLPEDMPEFFEVNFN